MGVLNKLTKEKTVLNTKWVELQNKIDAMESGFLLLRNLNQSPTKEAINELDNLRSLKLKLSKDLYELNEQIRINIDFQTFLRGE